jgi:hypothetical protein
VPVCAGEVLHADDTTVKVPAPGLGRTKTGRLWAAVRDERAFGGATPPAAFYRYSADRCAEHAQAPSSPLAKEALERPAGHFGKPRLSGLGILSKEIVEPVIQRIGQEIFSATPRWTTGAVSAGAVNPMPNLFVRMLTSVS